MKFLIYFNNQSLPVKNNIHITELSFLYAFSCSFHEALQLKLHAFYSQTYFDAYVVEISMNKIINSESQAAKNN